MELKPFDEVTAVGFQTRSSHFQTFQVVAISCADRCIRGEGGARAARQAAVIQKCGVHEDNKKKQRRQVQVAGVTGVTGEDIAAAKEERVTATLGYSSNKEPFALTQALEPIFIAPSAPASKQSHRGHANGCA
jgi:hypothetical protein